jgi:hypothetical protein
MRTVDELPQIPWVGRLSPPTISDARCARLVDALAGRAPRAADAPRRTTPAILGLAATVISVLLLHESAGVGSLRAVPEFGGGARNSSSSGVPEMKRMQSLMAGVLGAGAVTVGASAQNAVEWRVADGGNGHWYALRQTQTLSDWNWSAMKALAESEGGTLCTVSSSAENAFISVIIDQSGWSDAIALGGRYEPGSGWRWVDGSALTFTAWGGSSCSAGPYPNNNPQLTWCLGISRCSYGDVATPLVWDDEPMVELGLPRTAWMVEWSADCNNDGIVDYGQCRDGSLPDYDGNNVPDCCEHGAACAIGAYPVQWRAEDGGNGHWYRFVPNPTAWAIARAQGAALGGYLVTVNRASEGDFLRTLGVGTAWIGLIQNPASPTFSEPAGGWEWISGEALGYTNWRVNTNGQPNEPNNIDGTPTDVAVMDAPARTTWNDVPEVGAYSYWIEWSADCNADGIVDYGQILRGELADTNANGVPDTCESTLLVPSQYPTIQAAIDAVPANSQRTVQVAAGTYHEFFSLNGKNVLIRGAANNATILDGTGLPASIATFAGGEPATAGLENLVFRSGIVGSLIYKGALFKVGGAVYGRDSSAFIRNCRFENNRSDYGGAVYLIYSSLLVEGCVFTGNTGVSQGGGMMAFGSTGAIRNCVFTANQCGIAGSGGGSAFKAAEALFTGETVLLDGCTITGNTAGVDGSAVEYHEDVGLHLGKMRLVNCTITGNRSGTITPVGAGGLTVTGTMQSCIIDAGTTICDNLPREVQGPYLISGAPTICDCMADLSGDGVVNGGDLGLLLSAWGATLPTGVGDVDHDGVVNGADMALLLGSWGPCP